MKYHIQESKHLNKHHFSGFKEELDFDGLLISHISVNVPKDKKAYKCKCRICNTRTDHSVTAAGMTKRAKVENKNNELLETVRWDWCPDEKGKLHYRKLEPGQKPQGKVQSYKLNRMTICMECFDKLAPSKIKLRVKYLSI